MPLELGNAVGRRKGYTKLANFMVAHEHVMLRQFKELAVRDLLYLQAELCDLQYDYEEQADADASGNNSTRRYDREWYHLQSGEGGDGKQWQLALQIRTKLKEYYAAIQQYQAVCAVPRPSKSQRKIIHAYTYSRSLGGDCDFLGRDLGDEPPYPSLFDERFKKDHIFLGEDEGEDDAFSRFVIGPGLKCFDRLWRPSKRAVKQDEEKQEASNASIPLYHHYPARKLRNTIHVLGAALSSIIPVLSIIALFFVDNLLRRLGLVCLFTFLFAICMSVATKSRRIEIFGATAAFASVQVVFIGTTS